MTVVLWVLHMPRYFLGHVFGHGALFVKFVSLSLDGLATALMEVASYLADVDNDGELYDGFDDDEDGDDDEGLAS